jgi:hypothetical protein
MLRMSENGIQVRKNLRIYTDPPNKNSGGVKENEPAVTKILFLYCKYWYMTMISQPFCMAGFEKTE